MTFSTTQSIGADIDKSYGFLGPENTGSTLYPALDPSEPIELKYDEPFPLIPGVLRKTHATCGEVREAAACAVNPDHFSRAYPLKCGKLTCPICYPIQIKKATKRISDRIYGFNDAIQSIDTKHHPQYQQLQKESHIWKHVIISPPPALIQQTDDINRLSKIFITVLHNLGVLAGVYVIHPYRIHPDIRDTFQDMNHALIDHESDTERYWAQFVRRDVLGLGDWTKYAVWSLHVHALVCGRLLNADVFHQQSHAGAAGWTYKNLNPAGIDLARSYNPEKVGYRDPVRNIMAYQLDHAAYVPGRPMYRYMGALNPQSIKRLDDVVLVDMQRAVCPVCKAPVVRYKVDEYGDFIEPDNPVQCVCKLKQSKYEIRKAKKPKAIIHNPELKRSLNL